MPVVAGPRGSVPVGVGVDLVDGADGGVVFVWGMAVSCWAGGDTAGRRLAAVQLVVTGAAKPGEVAAGFGVDSATLWRWRQAYERGGAGALVPERRGPRGPSKLTGAVVAEIVGLRGQGASMQDIAGRVGVSLNSVSRALRADPAPTGEPRDAAEGGARGGLEPLARPRARDGERQAARRGELAGAEPRFTEGASQPLAGALVILPGLAVTGLLECVQDVYARSRAAFYSLGSLVLTVVFAALLGEPRAEGLTRVDPTDLGRLLGLDRAPEVATVRRRMSDLADQGHADELIAALARRHADTHPDALGVLYVDGHVRAYHGAAKLPKAHVARMRLSMPAEEDTWLADANGDPLLVWSTPPGASLAGELRRIVDDIRGLVGDRRVTIAFDRGGWSPRLFADLDAAGFDILTYRKAPKTPEPASAFTEHNIVDPAGREHVWLLADRPVRLGYTDTRRRKRRFSCRQITRADPDTGHQTQIITTRVDPDPAPLAYAMFSRWRQENFFRYMRAHYALDGLDTYTTTDDDADRMVPNPARRAADAELRQARTHLAAAEATEGRAALAGGRKPADAAEIADAFAAARTHIDALDAAAKAVPARVPLSEARPDAARLDPERKRLHDAIRMATYNAETALVRLIAPHYPRARHEARTLLREIFTTPADLQTVGDELHVTINPLTAPRRTRALAALCDDLTATRTTYPGTNLTLVYTTKPHP